MAKQVMVTHGGNKQKNKRSVVREAKEVIKSNKEGFRSVVPLVPANTMVVMYMKKKYFRSSFGYSRRDIRIR